MKVRICLSLPGPGRLLQSEVEAEDRHPGAETEWDQGEEEDHQEHPGHPLCEEGHRPDGGQQPEMGCIDCQVEKDHYVASEKFNFRLGAVNFEVSI